MLKDVPHIPFYDLSIVFQFLITEENFGNATILIHNAHLQIWGISVETLYQKAQQNASVLNPYEIKNMQEVLCEYIPDKEEDIGQAINNTVPVYVLSNKNRLFGASCILYPELIQDFAQAVGSDLYIIPSSVHEVLLLPTHGTEESEDIKRMVQEVNDTQVETEDVLSYSVYFFDKEKKSFCQYCNRPHKFYDVGRFWCFNIPKKAWFQHIIYCITPEFTILYWLNVYDWRYGVRLLGNFNC